MRNVAFCLVLLVLGFGANRVIDRQLRAELKPEQDLPDDVQAEVDATWERFLELFESRRRCFDDVSLLLVDEVAGGDARYVIEDRRIEIAIPTSPRRFRDSLAHELAHHMEHTCGAFGELRTAILAEPGMVGRDWSSPGIDWGDRPTEIYAEAVVGLVNGERVRHQRTMPIPPKISQLISGWG